MARVITDTRRRAVAALRSALPPAVPAFDLGPWHCSGSAGDPHEVVQWEGSTWCWHCGQAGTPGAAEAA